ncbi:unnamed protein product [Gadus morhua 'NCC']
MASAGLAGSTWDTVRATDPHCKADALSTSHLHRNSWTGAATRANRCQTVFRRPNMTIHKLSHPAVPCRGVLLDGCSPPEPRPMSQRGLAARPIHGHGALLLPVPLWTHLALYTS